VSSYLWSHYGDILGDEDATTAYAQWAGLVQGHPGVALDAGCAAGRFTFEMGKKCDAAIGIDRSLAFVRTARRLMLQESVPFSLALEGKLMEHKTIDLPEAMRGRKVEFIVADAQKIPFRSGTFSVLCSLNLVDKVPSPLDHLREMNRVATKKDAQFLISDPFSWSSEIAPEENWLGGTTDGLYAGKGLDNIFSILTGEKGGLSSSWKIDKHGHVWWKIRNHRNHFELIRSCFLKAGR
jgi:SAM-dependent methyltransferase